MRTRLLIACLAAAGCGDDDFSHQQMDLSSTASDGGDMAMAGAGLATPADFEAALAIANCKNEAKCGVIGASEEAACEAAAVAYAKGYPQPYSRAEATAAKRLGYSAAQAQACVDALEAAGCTPDQLVNADQICGTVFSGLVSPGNSCSSDGECQGGYCDRGAGSIAAGCAGVCVAWIAVAAACDPTNDLCDPAAGFCRDTTSTDGGPVDDAGNTLSTGVCTAWAKMADACDDTTGNVYCGPGLFCVATGGGTAGTCLGRGKAGDACTVFSFGDTNCQIDLYCDASGANPVCASRLATGAACSSFDACQDGLDCLGLDLGNGTAGKCGAFLDVGGSCDSTSPESGCPFGDTLCDATSMKCRAIGTTGDDCTNTQYCRGGLYCDAKSMCSPQAAFGAICVPPAGTDPDPCNAGTCDATAMTCTQTCT